MQISLSGQRALVTGGTRGIGAAIVEVLAEAGAEVVATGRDAETIARCREKAQAAKSPVKYEACDFSDAVAAEAFANRMGEGGFTILVNNAGINKIALAGDVDMADWDRVQQVNLRAPMLLCRALAPKMAERGYGRIVNIASIFGHVSRSKRVSYSTSKAGLLGITRAVALDYATRNVLVNAVAPGFIDTELTRSILSEGERDQLAAAVPMGRFGKEREIAMLVAFLASPANGYVTGQSVVADGGYIVT